MDLPDYDEIRRDAQRPAEEIRSEWKRKGIIPPRSFQERQMILSCTGKSLNKFENASNSFLTWDFNMMVKFEERQYFDEYKKDNFEVTIYLRPLLLI